MKFTVENEAFANALVFVRQTVPPRATIPILSHVAIDATEDNQISIRATNMEREVVVTLKAEVANPGKITVPGEILATLTKRLAKGGQCEVEIEGSRCKVRSGSAKYDLRTLPPEDFPTAKEEVADAVAFDMPAKALRELLERTLYAAAKDAVGRPAMGGPCLHIVGREFAVCATDGLRLALHKVIIPKGAASMPPVIIPQETVKQITAMLAGADGDEAQVSLSVSSRMIRVIFGSTVLYSSLIDAKFPEYERVIPKANGSAVSFRPYAMVEALDRATAVYAGEKGQSPTVSLASSETGLSLLSGVRGGDEATEICEADLGGHAVEVTLDAGFLAEALKAWPEDATVEMHHSGAGAAVLMIAKDRPEMTHVIMPRRR